LKVESSDSFDLQWVEIATPNQQSTINLTIALAQQNVDQLESRLLAVSTPGNAEYGNYLDADTANNLFAPAPGASVAVQAWLRNQGISKIGGDGHRLTFEITVESANKLLSTSFRIFQNTGSGISRVRSTQYSILDEPAEFIDFVTPTTYFGVSKPMQRPKPFVYASSKRNEAVSNNQTYKFCSTDDPYRTIITPDCQKELYNVGN
jgi:tripeptidyl-peptidase-1